MLRKTKSSGLYICLPFLSLEISIISYTATTVQHFPGQEIEVSVVTWINGFRVQTSSGTKDPASKLFPSNVKTFDKKRKSIHFVRKELNF